MASLFSALGPEAQRTIARQHLECRRSSRPLFAGWLYLPDLVDPTQTVLGHFCLCWRFQLQRCSYRRQSRWLPARQLLTFWLLCCFPADDCGYFGTKKAPYFLSYELAGQELTRGAPVSAADWCIIGVDRRAMPKDLTG